MSKQTTQNIASMKSNAISLDLTDVSVLTLPPKIDYRNMLRHHIMRRSLECLEKANDRRDKYLDSGNVAEYCKLIKTKVSKWYASAFDEMKQNPLNTVEVSSYDKQGYRIENFLFEIWSGWQVNASVYVPLNYKPPFPAVVIPVGHSGKQFENYQFPAQFFARCGYIAVLFDPPGQASEKQPGNDHFNDGVRLYAVGETSSQFFVADALRCIDYLQTRSDVDLSKGVAMTGVSGGAYTTALVALVDDRITVLGPSCGLAPVGKLDIRDNYCGCPETRQIARYADGVDDIDILCALCPKPQLLMQGEFDEVFHIADVNAMAQSIGQFYESAKAKDRFELFVDKAGHCYSLKQAEMFVKFMNRWLLSEPNRHIPQLDSKMFVLDPYEHLQCNPRTDINMRTIASDSAKKLLQRPVPKIEDLKSSISSLVDLSTVSKINVLEAKPFQIWYHYFQQLVLYPQMDIELPATLVYPVNTKSPIILHFDDQGRNRLLYKNEMMANAIGFLSESFTAGLLTVDLRGWGDTCPAMYPYELAPWAGIDRTLAYMSNALGDSIMSMRVRDGLYALEYLKKQSHLHNGNIIITGSGLGGLVALNVAAISDSVKSVAVWDTLVSISSLIETPNYSYPAEAFWMDILKHYDIPELACSLSKPVCIVGAKSGSGEYINENSIKSLNQLAGKEIYYPSKDSQFIIDKLRSFF